MLEIKVVTGTGRGLTELSAFDAALNQAGIHDYNLIPLSSVIPPRSLVSVERVYRRSPIELVGDRLYVVLAQRRTSFAGDTVAAGLGWCQFEDGRGVFVEHTAASDIPDEAVDQVAGDIHRSLLDLCNIRGFSLQETQVGLALTRVTALDQPVCALVAAIYQAEGWGQRLS